MTSHDRTNRLALLIVCLLAAACGGGSDTPTTPANTTGAPATVVVTIPAATLTLGDSAQAVATVRDAKGNVLSGAVVTWSSSASNILTVNATTGRFRALALDTASVIATVSGVSGSAPTAGARLTVRPPMTATVGMLPQSFVPVSFVLAVGGTVTYDFPSGIDHNVIFPKKANGQPVVTGAPSDILQTRATKVTRQFNTAGTFTYDCTIHPGMSGEVIVVP